MRDKIVNNYAKLFLSTLNSEFDNKATLLLDNLSSLNVIIKKLNEKLINPFDIKKFNIEPKTRFESILQNLFKAQNYKLIDRIINKLKSISSDKNQMKEYFIFSAVLLDNESKRKIEYQLSKTAKETAFFYEINKDLIDGILIKENHKILDLSMNKEIENLKIFLDKNLRQR